MIKYKFNFKQVDIEKLNINIVSNIILRRKLNGYVAIKITFEFPQDK